MKKSRITEIIKHFSKEEIKELKKFCRNPLTSPGRNIFPLLNGYLNYYPNFENVKGYSDENVFKTSYKDKTFNKVIFNKLNSDLITVIEDYISYKEFKSNEIERNLLLIKSYASKNDIKGMLKYLKKTERLINKIKIDANYFKYLRDLNDYYVYYFQASSDSYKLHLKNSVMVFSNMIKYFLTRIPVLVHDLIAIEFAYNYKHNETENFINLFLQGFDIEYFTNKVKNANFAYKEIIMIYAGLLKLFQINCSHEEYKNIFKLFKKNLNKFDSNEARSLGIILNTYCSIKLIEGNFEYNKESLKIYNLMLKNNIFIYEGFIPYQIFIDYVSKAFALNNSETILNFIKNYKEQLHPRVKNHTVKLSEALMYILNKDFEKSLKMLSDASMNDVKDKSDIKMLMAINYYELGYYSSLTDLSKSAIKFLESNKQISEKRREILKPFFITLNHLANYHLNKQEAVKLEQYEKEISCMKFIAHKSWLLQKIKSLKKDNHYSITI
jgi:hypothetical protein